jgi:hypothetical protein
MPTVMALQVAPLLSSRPEVRSVPIFMKIWFSWVIDWDELQEASLEKNFVESDAICCIVAHGEMLGEVSVLQPDDDAP